MEYTVRAAAIATGVSEDRLRTWERRYGIPAPPRSGTGRRLYGEADLAVIRRMAALVDSGLSAASAAATALGEAAPIVPPTPRTEADPRVVALVNATAHFDERLLLDLLATAVRSAGVEETLALLVLPALIEAGRRWERAEMTVAEEHLLSEVCRRWLLMHSDAAPDPPADAPRVLVACPEDERHDLGATALALLLRRAGLRVTSIGADVPAAALVDAVRAVRFDALCLSVTSTGALPMARVALHGVLASGCAARLYVGGAAITGAEPATAESLPAVRLPASITAAATMVAEQLRAASGA